MPFKNLLTVAEVVNALAYDPATGVFTWKISPAKNIKAGREAGCVKASRTKNGVAISYRYIRLSGQEVTAARLAWAAHYGEWPAGKLMFRDENTLNLRIDNLKLADSLADNFDWSAPGANKSYMKAHQAQFPESWKNRHLKQAFGINLAEYSAMHLTQNGKCAICDQPETQMRGGKVKALAVDHNHTTGVVRELLCCDCNTGIGKLKENRNVLIAALKYLDKHSGATPNVVKFSEEKA